MQYLVRIKPTSKRQTQVVNVAGEALSFEKRKAWYGPFGQSVASVLADLPENDLNPAASPKVFDVMPTEAARAAVAVETKREEPVGTVEQPTPPPVAAPPPPPPVEHVRRSHTADEVEAPKARSSSSSRRRKPRRG